jgi:hypothetical protein
VPLYLVGDEVSSLKTNLMRPYPRRDLDFAKKSYYRLLRARRTVEYAFGILEKKFVGRAIETAVYLVEASVKNTCLLHNFIKKEQTEIDRLRKKNFR